jgi:hypothetical protein
VPVHSTSEPTEPSCWVSVIVGLGKPLGAVIEPVNAAVAGAVMTRFTVLVVFALSVISPDDPYPVNTSGAPVGFFEY